MKKNLQSTRVRTRTGYNSSHLIKRKATDISPPEVRQLSTFHHFTDCNANKEEQLPEDLKAPVAGTNVLRCSKELHKKHAEPAKQTMEAINKLRNSEPPGHDYENPEKPETNK